MYNHMYCCLGYLNVLICTRTYCDIYVQAQYNHTCACTYCDAYVQT